MAYEAKVKDTSTLKIVQFAGIHEFVRYEWRDLPDDKYETARGNPHLETREVKGDTPKEESALPEGKADEILEEGSADELLAEAEEKPKPSKRRKRKK